MVIDRETQDNWRAKWIKALRSGEYKQTTGALRDNEGFCCLGVLCDITKDEVGGWWEGNGEGKTAVFKMPVHDSAFKMPVHDSAGLNTFLGILPHPVRELVGLTTYAGTYGENQSLAFLNDLGKGFDEIADIIEEGKGTLFEENRQWR